MKKLLIIIAAIVTCDAYGEDVYWFVNDNDFYKQTTCAIESNLNQPTTQPTKDGYRFIGWKGVSGPQNWKQMVIAVPTARIPTAADSSTTWSATFGTYGNATGERLCGSISGTSYTSSSTNYTKNYGTPDSSTTVSYKKNCWCKVTSVTFNGVTNSSPTSFWILYYIFDNNSACNTSCSNFCSSAFASNGAFRRAIFSLK